MAGSLLEGFLGIPARLVMVIFVLPIILDDHLEGMICMEDTVNTPPAEDEEHLGHVADQGGEGDPVQVDHGFHGTDENQAVVGLQALLRPYRRQDSTVRREVLGGVTTFLTMAYILFVNPVILKAAGMEPNAVFLATALASAAAMLMRLTFQGRSIVLKAWTISSVPSTNPKRMPANP